jgi:hypothetical protein
MNRDKRHLFATRQAGRRRVAGQALVFMVIAMIPTLAMVGLIVDGGNAWAQNRVTQNGSDASADAGATVLGQKLAENPQNPAHTSAYWDSDPVNGVAAAVSSNAGANGISVPFAYYTDICGVLLRPNGTKATQVTDAELRAGTSDAAKVGAGSLPTDTASTPDCGNGVVGNVAGVLALGTHGFNTFVAGIIGLNTLTANADATAVAGYLQNGPMLPIAFNVTLTYCDQQGDAQYGNQQYTKYVTVVLPICKHGPGNVGWIDWSPPNGGTPELIACTETPCNSEITLAQWMDIAQTGGTSSKPLEDAINDHIGDTVLLPMFDGTCSTWSAAMATDVNGTEPFGCASGDYGDLHGNSTWYRITQVGAFLLEHAYTNGNNKAECNPSWSNPPADDAKSVNCLIGQWVDFIDTGTVGANVGSQSITKVVGVQLIH